MATLGTRLWTWLRGELVGTDKAGNLYYRQRVKPGKTAGRQRERRWVIYRGEDEASKVPADWSAWLHHTVAEAPTGPEESYPWQKENAANPTGTDDAYRPPGSVLRGAKRAKATGDYEPWRPS
ncbi:MAG: NADH:ubiquinone oxidoreductase subunit NDUFA12 [Alphaproteobacteria bacterium]|jgi:NADH:ubiquinone oxidoreductase subunit|nr:NADH:ubiquinone oxidoreductase subunit NDUFA12 [Pseudomonadota bacterium]MCH7634402.1 NADH:ubiquinone oxidoreductase subunit NDUFA12 [Pseudomonadota bacterium]TDI57546.1 MAG: NADH:ubiquinone oxidoreductase subunit NDUFA12 [Alphaproteobacteria bacterium]